MTWIRTISPEEAGPELLAAYEDSHAGYPPEHGVRVTALSAVEEQGGAAGSCRISGTDQSIERWSG